MSFENLGINHSAQKFEVPTSRKKEFVEKEILPNGLELYICEMPSAYTARLTVKNTGPRKELEENAGASHLAECWVKDGSNKYPSVGIQETIIETLGGELIHEVDPDHIIHMIRLPASHGLFAIEFLADTLLVDTLLRREDFLREQKIAIEERLDELDDREKYARSILDSNAWKNHPSALKVGALGKIERIPAFGAQEIQKIIQDSYVPNNVILEVVGKVDAGRARDLVYQKFGRLLRGNDPQDIFPQPVYEHNGRRTIAAKRESGRAHIAIAFFNKDCTLASKKLLGIRILTQMLSKVVGDSVIDTHGYAHEATVGEMINTDFGGILIDIPVRPEMVDETLSRVIDDINEFQINEKNVLQGKGLVKGSLLRDSEATDKVAEYIEEHALVSEPIPSPDKKLEHVDSFPVEEIEEILINF